MNPLHEHLRAMRSVIYEHQAVLYRFVCIIKIPTVSSRIQARAVLATVHGPHNGVPGNSRLDQTWSFMQQNVGPSRVKTAMSRGQRYAVCLPLKRVASKINATRAACCSDTRGNATTSYPGSSSTDPLETLLLLNAMADPESSTLVIRGVIFDHPSAFDDIHREFANFEGYQGLNTPAANTGLQEQPQDVICSFTTPKDALKAFLDRPEVTIANRTYSVIHDTGKFKDLQPPTSECAPDRDDQTETLEDDEAEKACSVCRCKLDVAFSTPCLACDTTYCHECLKKMFEKALRDLRLMPARCECKTPMHHDVARGLLSEPTFEEYRQRYEQLNTANPLFCPVPTCSTFIPPRILQQHDLNVTCHACDTIICIECKQPAHNGRKCSEDHSRKFISRKFGYELRICPKCGAAVDKVDGTSARMKCLCKARWCWGCRRPWQVCKRTPCWPARARARARALKKRKTRARARALQKKKARTRTRTNVPSNTRAPSPHSVSSCTESEWVSLHSDFTASSATLDDERVKVHEADLSSDDESECEDVWACFHEFGRFKRDQVPEFWLVGVDVLNDPVIEGDCMSCFKKGRVFEDGHGKMTSAMCLNMPDHLFKCDLCETIWCGTCRGRYQEECFEERSSSIMEWIRGVADSGR